LLAETKRVDIGDECIGQVLSGSPDGTDGIWPAEPVRDLLEEVQSKHLREGIEIGRFNAAGVTVRDPFSGGKAERGLATKYESWARSLSPTWPHTGRMLKDIASTYRRWAGRHDVSSSEWRDSQ
jgi:hypothetical protein